MKNTFLRDLVALLVLVLLNAPLRSEELHSHQTPSPTIKRSAGERDYPPFVRECFVAAVEKLKKRAAAKEAVLKKETIKVEEVDDRWYNPSKYVWFSAVIETPEGVEKVTVMMQKPFRGACF